MSLEARLFDDDTKNLDSFGWLLVLTMASVAINSLFDFNNPDADLRGELMWVLASIIVGGTVQLAVRASGAARKPRIVASIIVWSFVVGAIAISFFGVSEGTVGGSLREARPSIFWVLLAFTAPLFVIRRLFRQGEVGRETLLGAFATFLLIALAFHYAFLATASWHGEFFTTTEPTSSFMYFSLVTITTLGYGDLQPITNLARFLSTAEAVVGQIFLVTIVARLVSLYGVDRSPKASGDQGEGSA